MATLDGVNNHATMQEGPVPPITINVQFLKDLTFENPNPLKSLQEADQSPEINIGINIKLEQLGEKTFEVSLIVSAEAIRQQEKIFVIEVDYAGIFTLGDVPQEIMHPILMIECPRLLFPWVRQIISNATREGGFAPLSLDPIDFAHMYQQQMERQEGSSIIMNA